MEQLRRQKRLRMSSSLLNKTNLLLAEYNWIHSRAYFITISRPFCSNTNELNCEIDKYLKRQLLLRF